MKHWVLKCMMLYSTLVFEVVCAHATAQQDIGIIVW